MSENGERWDKAHRDMDMIVANDLLWTIGHAIELAGKLPPDITWGWELELMRGQMERSIDHARAMRDGP
jgi:hypothetical protein